MLKKIAITGGIGSGKSLVLQCAKELGYPTFSCDEIYKNIMATQEYVEIIRKSFPTCVKNNIINKNLLADIVFNDEKALGKLNSVAHPLIMQTLHEEMEKLKEGIVFAEVPLLFEGNYENDFHETIYVKRNFEDRIQSIIERDKTDKERALKRIQAQFDPESIEGRKRLANIKVGILENNFDIAYIKNWLNTYVKN